MSDVLPEAVVKAKRWLAKTASDDQARNTEYEKLAAAYDGFLFDLDQGDMSKRNTIISRTLKDSSTSDEQAVMFYEIPANESDYHQGNQNEALTFLRILLHEVLPDRITLPYP